MLRWLELEFAVIPKKLTKCEERERKKIELPWKLFISGIIKVISCVRR